MLIISSFEQIGKINKTTKYAVWTIEEQLRTTYMRME